MTAYITKRNSKSGPRWIVRFRFGGRVSPLIHCGSFKTLRDARKRMEFVTAELAYGRDPRVTLAALNGSRAVPPTLDETFGQFIDSRLDVDDKTLRSYRNTRKRLRSLANMIPGDITPVDVQTWIVENLEPSDDWKPLATSSIRQYKSSLQQVLDFAGIEPNPVRSAKVKLPKQDKVEIDPPSTVEWELIKENLPRRSSLVCRVMECAGPRVDCEVLNLTYGDIDFANGRVRIVKTKGRSKGRRWLPLPDELLDEISDLVPLEDRHPDRKVWPNLSDSMVRYDMARACRDVAIAVYSPHDLRHRRCSLWYADIKDAVGLIRWSGHSDAHMFMSNYAHVILDSDADEWRDFWRGAWAARHEVSGR
jgi:integrase